MFSLQELWIKNFRSYKDLHLKNIPNFGLTLINGKNGSGKSTIRLAIEYILTDTLSEEISVDEFTFNKEGNCELGCIIHKNNGDIIKIVKYRDHKKYSNSTILEVNGSTDGYTENDRRQTQKNIEKLLGITKEEINISSIFSQESLSFPKCKEAERKKILYDALNLHKYTEKHNKIKDKITDTQKSLDSLIIRKNSIEDVIKDRFLEIERLKEKSSEWEKNRISNIEDMKLQILEIQNKEGYNLKKLNDEKKELEELISKYRKEVEVEENELNSLLQNKGDDKVREEFIVEFELVKKNKIRTEVELSNLKKDLKKVGTGVCPVLKSKCNQLLERENEIKENTEKAIEYKIAEYEKSNLDFERMQRIEADYIKLEKDLKTRVDNLREKIKGIQNLIYISSREIQHKEELISKALVEEQEKKERIIKIEENIEKKKNEEDPYISIIDDSKKYIENKKKDLDDFEEDSIILNERLKYWNFIKVMYSKSGIPNMRMEGFLESLEMETNKILSTISDKLYVKIDSQGLTKSGQVREKIDYSVHHPDKKITNFWSYSGGQRHRINLASMFAFNSLLGKFDFMVLDEVLELSLDTEGKEDVITLLKNKAKETGTILCISHDSTIKDSFNSVLNIRLEDEISYIE